MLRPQWNYNYGIITPDLREHYRTELGNILKGETVKHVLEPLPEDFHIISFPAIERKTVLLHSALAHEVGHLVAKRFLSREFKTDIPSLATKIRQHVTSEEGDPDLFVSVELIDEAQKILKKGVIEIASDIFAVLAVGPAALFAMLEMALADALDLAPTQLTSYYPPWRTRLRIATANLKKEKLLSVTGGTYEFDGQAAAVSRVAERIQQIEDLVAETSDAESIEREWLVKTTYEAIDKAIPQIEDYIRKEYGPHLVHAPELYENVFPLVHRLTLGIPPNAIESNGDASRVASLEEILNAAWFYRIAVLDTEMSTAKPGDKIEQQYAVLNRLTLRAIELSHVQESYNEFRAGSSLT